MSQPPVTGSLAFAARGGVVFSSGLIGGRVALAGPLSERRVTLGLGLRIAPGSRHWLNEVATGDIGVFLPGDEHDAIYAPGSLYATATLSAERLEEIAEHMGLVLDVRTLGGTGFDKRRVDKGALAGLRTAFARVHDCRRPGTQHDVALGDRLLALAIAHFGRSPRPRITRSDPRGHARVVARARAYIAENLEGPLSINAIAAASGTSRRTLHRAFTSVLDETPQSYVRKLRLHCIRRDLVSRAEVSPTIARIANRWGISELGRLSASYRALFGELPSQTLARHR